MTKVKSITEAAASVSRLFRTGSDLGICRRLQHGHVLPVSSSFVRFSSDDTTPRRIVREQQWGQQPPIPPSQIPSNVSYEGNLTRLGGSYREPGKQHAPALSPAISPIMSPSEIQHMTSMGMIHELIQQQSATYEKLVPWFLENMPSSYFRLTSVATRYDHIRAIAALQDAQNMDCKFF
jgi:hypothetical protein